MQRIPNRVLGPIAFLACCVGVGMAWSFGVRLAKPKLACDVSRYDFGEIPPGEPVTKRFRVANVGLRPVRIRDARSTCSCADVRIEPGTLERGDSSELIVSLRATADSRWSRARIWVTSTEPKVVHDILRVVGRAAPPLVVFLLVLSISVKYANRRHVITWCACVCRIHHLTCLEFGIAGTFAELQSR